MTEKTGQKKRRKYDEYFKAEVLKMVASGRPVREISQALGLGENIIYRWKSKQMQGSSGRAKGEKEVDIWQELEVLQAKLRQMELERDILKKALAIFSRPT